MAVGDGMESAFAAWWDGKVWAPVKVSPLPAGATDSSLAGVSCEARTVCTLVGAYGKANGELFTLAQSWNGKTLGASEKVPSPTGAVESNPGGVSCKTAAFCLAAGGSETPTTESPLALRESGTTWSLVDPTSTTPPKALRCHESAYGQCQQLRCPRSRKPS
jgi:hypothetical protein